MLSAFESALLDRHLRGCADCRSFAADARAQTTLLREAPLEQPTRTPVPLPAERPRVMRRGFAGALSAAVVAVAAAVMLVWTAPSQKSTGQAVGFAGRVGAPVMVVFPAKPSMNNVNVEVPRIHMRPASIADGPVHGYFSEPVSV